VNMSFVVMSSTEAELGFTIVPITAGFSGDVSRKALHKLTVIFQDPEK